MIQIHGPTTTVGSPLPPQTHFNVAHNLIPTEHPATNPKPDNTSAASRSATTHNNIYATPTNPVQPPDRPASTQAAESFTSKAALQPTFSINIVRTPDHYASPTPSRASHRSTAPTQIYAASPQRSASRGGSSVDSMTSQFNHLTTSSTAPLSRHHSMPTTLNTHTNTASFTGELLTDEPASMLDVLSPLVIPMTPKPVPSRSGLGRHSSVPAGPTTSLDTIPETSSTTSSATSPGHSRSHTPAPSTNRHSSHQEPLQSPHAYSHSRSRSTSRPSSRHSSRPGSNSTSPYSVPHSNEQSPISPTYPHSSGHSPHNAHFPYASHPHPHSKNPLPAPPAEIPFPNLSQIPSTTTPTPSNPTANHTSPGTSNSSYIYMPAAAPPPPHTRTKSHTQQQQTSGTAILHSHGSSTITTLTSSPPHSPTNTSRNFDHSLSSPPQHQYSSDSISANSSEPKKKRKSSSSSSKSRRRRKGFWNRRGDHVTQQGYIVYAPHDMVYPPDLDGYPDGKDGGYMNEAGMMTSWQKRPAIEPPGGYESVSLLFPSLVVQATD